jgi:hypothetical protein
MKRACDYQDAREERRYTLGKTKDSSSCSAAPELVFSHSDESARGSECLKFVNTNH